MESVIPAVAKTAEGFNILNNQEKGNRTVCQSDELTSCCKGAFSAQALPSDPRRCYL